jgi:digeranylgeranylglycerophospholipid reductase
MKSSYDVVIVGGGPIGGHVASLIAREGYSTLILEEHRHIGEPMQCAGIFSPKVMDIVDCRNSILNRIKGADIYSPSGKRISITAKKDKAVVVDRILFDKTIVEDATAKGAELALGSRVIKVRTKSEHVEVGFIHETKNAQVQTELLIGADGAGSIIAKRFGLPRAAVMLPGVQEDLVGAKCEKTRVKIFVGRDVAPGFFGWIIPAGDLTRIGLCTSLNAPLYLRKLKTESPAAKLVKGAERVSALGGGIPIGIVEKTYAERVMIVGDAAAQVKATSGGGIYPGLVCAGHCAKTAVEALEKEDFSEKFLAKYQKQWMNDIGRELKKDWMLYKIFQKLSDERIEEAFELLDNPKILRLIESKGDIDYPSKLALPLVRKEPRLLGFASSSLVDFILG